MKKLSLNFGKKKTEKKAELPKKTRVFKQSDSDETTQRYLVGFDRPFFLIVIVLLCIGTTFVFSSSYVYAEHNFDDSYYFAKRQIAWAIVAVLIMLFCAEKVDYLFLKRFAVPLFIVSYILLISVFIIGTEHNGAKRWLDLGFFSIQPSEIVKFAIIVITSKYIVSRTQIDIDAMRNFNYGIRPFAILLLAVAIPLYFQPHLSAMIIIAALMFCIMYLGGTKKSILIGTGAVAALGLAGFVLLTSHGKSRIDNWLHPELDIMGKGWQPLQSLYAIGSGGMWGVGIGQSKQKHLYLPEPQNDYIFSIICEEMGFVFAIFVIGLFVALIVRGFVIAKNAPSKFSSLLVMGIIIQVALQVFLNIAVVTNSIPCTGVSLPFFSYGGTSLSIFMAEMGIVLNVSKYSYKEKD